MSLQKQLLKMEKHCTTVYFLVKKSRQDKEGLSPIVAYINVNTERTSYYTSKKIQYSDWDSGKQIVKGKGEDAKQINELVSHKVEADVHSIQQALSDYEDEHKHKEDKFNFYGFHEFKLADD